MTQSEPVRARTPTPNGDAVREAHLCIQAISEERRRYREDTPTWRAFGFCSAICQHVAEENAALSNIPVAPETVEAQPTIVPPELRVGRFEIEDDTFVNVRGLLSGHLYLWQTNPETGAEAQINLSQQGAVTLAHTLLQSQPVAGREAWVRLRALCDAHAECDRVREQTSFSTEVGEAERKGYADGCRSCAASVRIMGSRVETPLEAPPADLCEAQPVAGDMVMVRREALHEVSDLLAERIHGSPARSPAHNARLKVDAMLTAHQQEAK